MKKIAAGICVISLFSACVVPVNTSFESARMLNKNNFEISGHYSHYNFSEEGETETVNDNFGLRLGYGITDWMDVKARYERLNPVDEGSEGVNYLDVAPKFQILPRYIAGTLPVGLYFADEETEWVISPKVLFTYPANDIFEVTLATKADIFPEDEGDVYLGVNLGFGLSSNLNRWALRPELGLMTDPGESGVAWTFGLGLSAIIQGSRR